jgi:hypothetical protein
MDREQGPMEMLDAAALLHAAEIAGYEVSARMLETFRAEGLIPRPSRAGYRGRAPVWAYPDGADQQLIALLRWRGRTKSPEVLRVLLWLDGFPIPPQAVRDALVGELSTMLDSIDREITSLAREHGLDPHDEGERGQALQLVAGVLAAKRGPRALPRHGRVRAAERARAVEVLLRTFAFGERVEAGAGEADTVERVLGAAPNGRRHRVSGAGPWLTGPAEALLEAGDVVALPSILESARQATDAELDTVRRIVIALFRHLPLVARMVNVMFDDDNYAGLGGLAEVDRNPEIVMLLIPSVLGMVRAGWQDNLQDVTTALERFPDLLAQTEQVLDLPQKTVEANLSTAAPEVRMRADRIIAGALKGKLGPLGGGRQL